MSHHGRRPRASRVVGYALAGTLNDSLAESLLCRARAEGVVTGYDAGRGAFLWFDGPPGPALRAFRVRLAAAVGGRPERRR